MSEIKVLKRATVDPHVMRMEAIRLKIRDEYAIVERKVHGMVGGLAEIERRLAEIDRLIKGLK